MLELADGLTIVTSSQSLVRCPVDVFADEADRTVTERKLHTTDVLAASGPESAAVHVTTVAVERAGWEL